MSQHRDLVKIFLLSVFSRYKRGKATRSEEQLVDKFFDQNSYELNQQSTSHLEDIKSKMKQEIDLRITDHAKKQPTLRRIFLPAAAVLLIFLTFADQAKWYDAKKQDLALECAIDGPTLSLGNLHFDNLLDSVPQQAHYRSHQEEQVLDLTQVQLANASDSLIITNPTTSDFPVLLADGTLVRLASQARIAFLWNQVAANRTLHMYGKVSFDVATLYQAGKKIPFTVKTTMQKIAVLGTEFIVDASAASEHSVLLHEGSIQLSHVGGHDKVILRPGQKAFVAENNPRIYVATAVENQQKLIAWRKQQFHFDDQPLGEVMNELSDWYERIIYVEKSAQSLPITGMIRRYSRIEDIIEIIQMTNTITYYEKKGVIYVRLKK